MNHTDYIHGTIFSFWSMTNSVRIHFFRHYVTFLFTGFEEQHKQAGWEYSLYEMLLSLLRVDLENPTCRVVHIWLNCTYKIEFIMRAQIFLTNALKKQSSPLLLLYTELMMESSETLAKLEQHLKTVPHSHVYCQMRECAPEVAIRSGHDIRLSFWTLKRATQWCLCVNTVKHQTTSIPRMKTESKYESRNVTGSTGSLTHILKLG